MSVEARPAPGAPAADYADQFCHIAYEHDDQRCYCGIIDTGPVTCNGEGGWDGETVCPCCGLPVCVTCIRMSNTEDLLEEDD